MSRLRFPRRLRRVLVAVGCVFVAAFVSVVIVLARAWLEASREEGANLECSVTPRPHNTVFAFARKTDDGYVCVFTDQRGRTIRESPPNPQP